MGGAVNLEPGAATSLLLRPVLGIEGLRVWFTQRSGRDSAYLNWRHVTAYGDQLTTMSAQDLVNYLSWRREMRAIRKWERVR